MAMEYQPKTWIYAGEYSAQIGDGIEMPFEVYAGRGKIGIAPVKDEVVIETHTELQRDSITAEALFEVLEGALIFHR